MSGQIMSSEGAPARQTSRRCGRGPALGYLPGGYPGRMSAALANIGSRYSLGLVVFAELFCAILIVLGLGTRFAAIPIIVTMAVAAFIVLAGNPFDGRELALLYLTAFTTILVLGAGSYSLDKAISGK